MAVDDRHPTASKMERHNNNCKYPPAGRPSWSGRIGQTDSSIYSATLLPRRLGSVQANAHVVINVDGSRVDRILQSSLPDGQNIQTVEGDNVSDQRNTCNKRSNVNVHKTQANLTLQEAPVLEPENWDRSAGSARRATSAGCKRREQGSEIRGRSGREWNGLEDGEN